MRLIMIFFVVLAISTALPLFAAEESGGTAGNISEVKNVEENIFIGINPKLRGEALRSAIVKVVSRALKFGMEPEKILAMAKANPLAKVGADAETKDSADAKTKDVADAKTKDVADAETKDGADAETKDGADTETKDGVDAETEDGVDTETMVVTTLATMFASQWLNDDEVYRIAKKLLVPEKWVQHAWQMAEQGYITPFIGTFPSVPYSNEGRDNIPPPEIPRGDRLGDGGEPSETPASPSTF